ncbi:hypothetical protein ACHAXR_004471 [Thalassiosira sp. AJA248-18]
MMKNPLSLALLIAYPIIVGAFGVNSRSLTHRPSHFFGLAMSSPGDWENDDFLESLSGGGGGGGGSSGDPANEGDGQAERFVERIVPQNDLTDEEITAMAMRSAQFYNTDAPIEEVYGIPDPGPPKKQEENEGDDWQ